MHPRIHKKYMISAALFSLYLDILNRPMVIETTNLSSTKSLISELYKVKNTTFLLFRAWCFYLIFRFSIHLERLSCLDFAVSFYTIF